jgi:deoxyribonuclease-4
MCANLTTVIDTALSSDWLKRSQWKLPALLLETPAGQGTELGIELEEFGKIWRGLPSRVRQHMGICVDTCHIFSAGYDIRSKTGVKDWFRLFDHHIGLKNLKLVHLNDSKKPLNSRLDRHARMGDGYIADGLGHMVRTIWKLGIPTVIETPGDLRRDIALVSSWLSSDRSSKKGQKVVEI